MHASQALWCFPVLRLQTADLSAKNLGNEGFAYVVDALSFNDRCVHVAARPPPAASSKRSYETLKPS